MPAKFIILMVINLVFWGVILVYSFFCPISSFMLGVCISFSISTLIGLISSLSSLFVSIFIAWGLYFLAWWEGTKSSLIAACAIALTIGAIIGFILSRPKR